MNHPTKAFVMFGQIKNQTVKIIVVHTQMMSLLYANNPAQKNVIYGLMNRLILLRITKNILEKNHLLLPVLPLWVTLITQNLPHKYF